MDNKQEKIASAMADLSNQHTPTLIKAASTVCDSMFNKGMTMKEATGRSDASMERQYAQAYQLYNTGKYIDACNLFRVLMVQDMTDSRYILGIAASLHRMGEFEKAADTYLRCGMIDTQNPVPHYHAADCYVQMGDSLSAQIMLEIAIKRAGDKPQYAVIRERAHLMIQSLRNGLKEDLAS